MGRVADGLQPANTTTTGLSIRQISTIRRILSTHKRLNNTEPEDAWFHERIAASATETIAPFFQGSFSYRSEVTRRPVGYNVPRERFPIESGDGTTDGLLQEQLRYCPELSLILGPDVGRRLLCADDGDEGVDIALVNAAAKYEEAHGADDKEDGDGRSKRAIIPPESTPPSPLRYS